MLDSMSVYAILTYWPQYEAASLRRADFKEEFGN
jgi:hypothetical protein